MGRFSNRNMGNSGGGMSGPLLLWKPKGDDVWNIPMRNFAVRVETTDGGAEMKTVSPQMVLDIEHIRVGWCRFEDKRPNFQWKPAGDLNVGSRPDDSSKPNGMGFAWESAFFIMTLVKDANNRKIAANWAQSTRSAVTGFEKLLDDLDSDPHVDSGDLPVVQFHDVEVIPTKNSPLVVPRFKILKWIPRPEELPNTDPLEGTGAPITTPPSRAGAAPAPAPARPSPGALAAAAAAQAPMNGGQADYYPDMDDEIPF